MDDDPLLTCRQVGVMLGVSARMVRRYVGGDRFRPAACDLRRRGFLFRKSTIEAFLGSERRKRLDKTRSIGDHRREYIQIPKRRANFLDTLEAATFLDVNPATVRCMARRKDLTTYYVTSKMRPLYDRDELQDLLDERRAKAAKPHPPVKVVRKSSWRKKPVQTAHKIKLEDLHSWERHFGNELTTRQVAFLLRVTLGAVSQMRRLGYLHPIGKVQVRGFGRPQWIHDGVEVLRLKGKRLASAYRDRYYDGIDRTLADIRQRKADELEYGPLGPERRCGIDK